MKINFDLKCKIPSVEFCYNNKRVIIRYWGRLKFDKFVFYGGEEMSNNKQSMKLYTEEQVRLAMYFARGHNKMTDSQFIDSLIPIELPSDEEIQKESLKSDFEYTFRNGAKWMRDKIGGNNEQQ